MATCIFDNPLTMSRESWEDGQLMYSYSFDLLYRDLKFLRPFDRTEIREWKSGQILGDPTAIKQRNGERIMKTDVSVSIERVLDGFIVYVDGFAKLLKTEKEVVDTLNVDFELRNGEKIVTLPSSVTSIERIGEKYKVEYNGVRILDHIRDI